MDVWAWLKRILGRSPELRVDDDPRAPGWKAIDAALAPLYRDQPPKHWGTLVSWSLGGPDPLDGTSAYEVDGELPHWHYVSYGLSDLYDKTLDDAPTSGFGFELTFRLARSTDDHDAPIWPVSLLQSLARYVFETGNVLESGHHMAANGPIRQDAETSLVAFLFMSDPQLSPINTPNGTLEFIQVVGITDDEYSACRSWNADSFADILRRGNPLLVTDLDRVSLLADPEIAAEIIAGRGRDGSSSAGTHHEELTWSRRDDEFVVSMIAGMFAALPLYLANRLSHGRTYTIWGAERAVQFAPGVETRAHEDGATLAVSLSEKHMAEISVLPPAAGRHRLTGTAITLEVRPSALTRET